MFRGVRTFDQPLSCSMAQAQIDAAKQAEQLASGVAPAKKPRKVDPLLALLKKKAPVHIVDGKRVFLSQSTAKPTERRFGVPVWTKKRELKAVLGCFASFQEVFNFLQEQRKAGVLDMPRYEQLCTDVSDYMQAKPEILLPEADLDVYAATVAEKPPKKEKPPKVKKEQAPDAPTPAAPKQPKQSSSQLVIVPGDVAMEDVDPEKAVKVTKLQDAFFDTKSTAVQRLEVIFSPTEGVVMFKRLEKPGAATLKQLARASGVSLESLNVPEKAARDGKYSVVIRAAHLKLISKEKQKKAAAKAKSEGKQKKVKAARDVAPIAV